MNSITKLVRYSKHCLAFHDMLSELNNDITSGDVSIHHAAEVLTPVLDKIGIHVDAASILFHTVNENIQPNDKQAIDEITEIRDMFKLTGMIKLASGTRSRMAYNHDNDISCRRLRIPNNGK